MTSPLERKSDHKIVIILGIILVCFNLSIPTTITGPVIGTISKSFHLTNSEAGFLTTLQLVASFLFTPIAIKIGSRWGFEKTMFLGIVGVFLGEVLRPSGGVFILFAGTFVTGTSLAICTTLLPGYIKKHFDSSFGLMVSLRIVSQNAMSIVAAAACIPLAEGAHLGWRKMFILWSLMAALAAIVWIPQLRKSASVPLREGKSQTKIFLLLRSRLAWNISLYFGSQAFIYMGLIAWLPSMVKSFGLSTAQAGYMLALYQMAGLPVAIVAPALAQKMKNQKFLSAIFSILYIAGLIGLLLNHSLFFISLCMVLMGISSSLTFSLYMLFIGLRAETNEDVNALSGMSQIVSNIISAVSPLLIGWVFDITGVWVIPILILISAGFLLFITGFVAGSDKKLHLNEMVNTKSPDSVYKR